MIIEGASANFDYEESVGNRSNKTMATSPFWPLQNVIYGKGTDEKGNYFSIYDKYDFDFPGEKYIGNPYKLAGNPYEIYDRAYYRNTVQGVYEPQYYSNKELENIDLSKLNKSEIDNVRAELQYKGFETYTDKQLAQSLKRYQDASKNPKDTLPQTTPQYNSTPNKYGKPKKNVNRNVLAEGGSLDGLEDPPIVFDPNALRNSDPKLQPSYTKVDNTRVNIIKQKVSPPLPPKLIKKTESTTPVVENNKNTKSDFINKQIDDYTKEIENPGLLTQTGEALQLPLRYLSNPLKLVGDLTNTFAPNSPLNSILPNTEEDRYNYRKETLNPIMDSNTKINNVKNEVLPLTTNALINTGALELGALFNGQLPNKLIPLVETGSKANFVADILQVAQSDPNKLTNLDPSELKELFLNLISLPSKLDNFNAQDIKFKLDN